ncbi:FAD-dependent oxidoreductase [Haliea sp. E17]|uniref:FAD-dependent oxidoreductase n=1 Tax=Haliea sp. E17 TaxID=3401576 RepID=UPI003AABF29B
MTAFDETFDFVVVGSGGGSMSAALYLRSLGKRVLILEKLPIVGGTTGRSGGVMWIPNNRFMARDGVPDSPGQALAYLEATTADQPDSPAATPERRQMYVAEAPRMLEFLISQGIRLDRAKYWPDYYDEAPGGSEQGRTVRAEVFDLRELGEWADKLFPGFTELPAYMDEMMLLGYYRTSWQARKIMLRVALRTILARLTGKRLVTAGAALQGRMLQASLRAGVEIRTETPVSELVFEDGAVKGVIVNREGQPWRIGATLGVLMNAGGFSHNATMREHYIPNTEVAWSNASVGNTGEMIETMARHGAATANMGEMVGFQSTFQPGWENDEVKSPAQRLTAAPHAILVDQGGQRYMNEGGSYMAYCKGMLERHKDVPAVPSWAVFDSRVLQNYMIAGTMPGSKKPQSWYDEDFLKQADSIEALAERLGIAPEALAATVQRFNGFVDAGRDEDFGRGARAYDRWLGDPAHQPNGTLGRIEEGPFYAVPVNPGDVGTYGGVVTDEYARVLKEDGSVIPGLYAVGICAASMNGGVYPGAGCSIGPAFTFGYVAARHATGEFGA